MGTVIGVDIGGSGVRAASVDARGSLGSVGRRTLATRDLPTVVQAVRELVAGRDDLVALGVGVPGYVHQNRVLASPNFPDWKDVPLGRALEEALGVPVAVENDANCAALGAHLGDEAVLLTLGTGVGGGVITGGQLVRGVGGVGGEVGHIYVGGELRCGCGGLGCLETWCSTWALVKRAEASGHTIEDGEQLIASAEAGEAWAQELLRASGEALGRGLLTLIHLFNPSVVGVAGGLSLARPWLEPPALAWLRSYGIPQAVSAVRLDWLGPADTMAIRGAAAVARAIPRDT